MNPIAWYQQLGKSDRVALSNISYGFLGTVISAAYAGYTGSTWPWFAAAVFLIALTFTAVADLDLIAHYRRDYKERGAKLEKLLREWDER